MATAVPLPPGKIQFCDANGAPYAGGEVFTYVPGTLTPKTTWLDPAQAVPNLNPIILDAAGRAVIFGSGVYRQQLFDRLGNLIWDQLTEGADPDYILSALPDFVGDTGAGGVAGIVPAPPAGSAAAGEYLSADGGFQSLLVEVPATPAANQAGLLFVPTRTITTTAGATVLTDAAGCIQYENAAAGVLAILSDASVSWLTTVVTQIMVYNQIGSGALTLTPASGVSLVWPGGSVTPGSRVLAANGQCILSRVGANSWTVIGAGIS